MVVFVLLFLLLGCVFVEDCQGYVGQRCRYDVDCQIHERCTNQGLCECYNSSFHEVGKWDREHCADDFQLCVYDEDCGGEAKCIASSSECKCPMIGYIYNFATDIDDDACVPNTDVWVGVAIAILVGVGILIYVTYKLLKYTNSGERMPQNQL